MTLDLWQWAIGLGEFATSYLVTVRCIDAYRAGDQAQHPIDPDPLLVTRKVRELIVNMHNSKAGTVIPAGYTAQYLHAPPGEVPVITTPTRAQREAWDRMGLFNRDKAAPYSERSALHAWGIGRIA